MKLIKPIALALSIVIATPAFADENTSGDVNLSVLHCNAPVKKILVGKVTCKASSCAAPDSSQQNMGGLGALIQLAQAQESGAPRVNSSGLSASLSEMFTSSLRETGCFNIVDQEGMAQVKEQMESLGKKFEPANDVDLIVNGTITSITGSSKDEHFLWLHSNSSSTELTFDTKVIDARQATVVGGGAFTGKSSKNSANLNLGLFKVGGEHKSNPLEAVAREAIIRATNSIVTQFAWGKK